MALVATALGLAAGCSGSPVNIVMSDADAGPTANDAAPAPARHDGGDSTTGSTPGAEAGAMPEAGPTPEPEAGSLTEAGPTPEAGPIPEAGPPDSAPGSTACGASLTCRYGQTCVSGACEYVGCVGAHVPGDYATFDAAIAAIGTSGGTICLGAGDFSHPAANNDPYATMVLAKDVTIVGVSAAKTSIGAWLAEGPGALTVRGVAMQAFAPGEPWSSSITLEACDFTPYPNMANAALSVGGASKMAVRGSHIHGGNPGVPEIQAFSASGIWESIVLEDNDIEQLMWVQRDYSGSTTARSMDLVVRNNWFHAPGGEIDIDTATAQQSGNILIVNNTFDHGAIGVGVLQANPASWPLTVANNIFSNESSAAIDVEPVLVTPWTQTNNAFFGNAANYAGKAVPGANAVTADCQYTASSPPSLAAGSPCRGKALAADAPADDYWGTSRGQSPDLGAVQASP